MRRFSAHTLLFSAAVLCALYTCGEGSGCTVKVNPYLSNSQDIITIDKSSSTYTHDKARSVLSYPLLYL